MSGRGQHWAEIGESTSVGGILLLCAVHRWLGRWPFRVCVYPVVLVHWLPETDFPLSGDEATERFIAGTADVLKPLAASRSEFYRMDTLRRVD